MRWILGRGISDLHEFFDGQDLRFVSLVGKEFNKEEGPSLSDGQVGDVVIGHAGCCSDHDFKCGFVFSEKIEGVYVVMSAGFRVDNHDAFTVGHRRENGR